MISPRKMRPSRRARRPAALRVTALAAASLPLAAIAAQAQQLKLASLTAPALQPPASQPPAPQALPAAPSATVRPLVLTGGVLLQQPQSGLLRLTLTEAVDQALKSNTEILVRSQQERFVSGQVLSVGSALTPNLEAKVYSQAQEINLAAMGFKPGAINIPGFNSANIPTIVKVNTTGAQLSLSQTLFNVPAYFLFRAAQKAVEATSWATLSARGGVVLNTGATYLKILADRSEIANAQALLRQDQVVYDHARAELEAGTGIHLNVLRAQTDLLNQQQRLVNAVTTEAKDKITLNRLMGQPPGQQLELVDTIPFADFQFLSLDDALRLAYEKRKDLRGLEAQLVVAQKTAQAVRYERLPTLGVGGFYGVLGETTGLYHGVFTAQGQLTVPVFIEATLRGQREVAQAQITGLDRQIAGRRSQIEADIRSSMLDVQSSAELVKVARSNVELATQALSDATQRFTSGVDDNLPVARAQAALVGAQSQLTQAEFQYNYAKLQLARNTGVVETQYHQYLGQ